MEDINMNYIYASRYGNTEGLVKALNLNALRIVNGDEKSDKDFVLFTYTDGNGIVPGIVNKFLKSNYQHLKAVIALGNKAHHPQTFAVAGDKISNEYKVPLLAKVDTPVNEDTISHLKQILENY